MPAPAALEGLRVLDLTHSTFNYAGKLLAGFGAQVVKIEPPGGDPIRHQPPFQADRPNPETSGRHLHMNTGKMSVILDLDNAEDVARLKAILPEYDIVIESRGAGYLATRGLGYEDLKALRPDLIMASISHFGQTGPYAGYVGTEIVADALAGYLNLTGEPEFPPVKCFDNLVEHQAALQTAVATMVAVTSRDATGQGDYLDISATEAAMFLLGGPAQTFHWMGAKAKRNGTRLLFSAPDTFYPSCLRPCLGGYVHVHTNTRYPDLMGVLMEQDELNDPEIMATPTAHADRIDELMGRWLMQHDKFEVVRLGQAMRLPFTEVLTPAEIAVDEHLKERGFFAEVDHPVAGKVKQPGAPGMLTGTPWQTRRAPLLGEHQAEVLKNG
jgi:crotonobetainyl-CoA:carnitine CoA-transferase CaiB-like acyl-CoA transferase